MSKEKMVEVIIEDIDDELWSKLLAFAKREGKTVDQVASEAIKWAYENDKLEEVAKACKKEQEKNNGKK